MNELLSRFGTKHFAVLGFPCNQFGHQENSNEAEIPLLLKHVRPGNNFEYKMELFSKIDVNGEKSHPLFEWLRRSLPAPIDNTISLMTDPKLIIWSPVTRTDISWNFEKFLIAPDGTPFRRYSAKFETKDIADDIECMLADHTKL
ncbi:glutathione peroxidase gpx1 [Chamberlinius hualienensis]